MYEYRALSHARFARVGAPLLLQIEAKVVKNASSLL